MKNIEFLNYLRIFLTYKILLIQPYNLNTDFLDDELSTILERHKIKHLCIVVGDDFDESMRLICFHYNRNISGEVLNKTAKNAQILKFLDIEELSGFNKLLLVQFLARNSIKLEKLTAKHRHTFFEQANFIQNY